MREIGYRAWLKEEKRFIYPKLILNDFGSVVEVAYNDIDISSDEIIERRLIIEDVVLEQFTGLRDKNRKRIYEGDIIRVDAYGNYKVTWDNATGGFELKAVDPNVTDQTLFAFHRILQTVYTVIGDIHRNPELLEEVK